MVVIGFTKDRICVPQKAELKTLILDEGHKCKLSLHPGMTKMYQDLKKMFWWLGMKRNMHNMWQHV